MPRLNPAAHLAPHRFAKGHPGGPGRPIGSRAKLQELAVALLHADFAQHGEDVIRRVRERKPEVYLASVVSLLPKQAQKLESPFVDLSDEELEQLEQLLRAIRAQTVQAIEGTGSVAAAAKAHRSPRAQALEPGRTIEAQASPKRTSDAPIGSSAQGLESGLDEARSDELPLAIGAEKGREGETEKDR